MQGKGAALLKETRVPISNLAVPKFFNDQRGLDHLLIGSHGSMKNKHDPSQGKWTLKRLLKREIEYHGGEMPLEALLNRMSLQGYLKKPLLQKLDLLDVDVVDGKARLRYG